VEERKAAGIHVGCHVLRRVPRDPLAIHLAVPNRVLGGEVCLCTTPRRLRRPCAAISLCALKPMAAQALAFPPWLRHGRGAQLASLRRASFIKMALRGDRKGTPRSGEGVRPSSPSIQIAKQNRSAGTPAGRSGDSASARTPAEHAVWQSEVKRKGVAGDTP
jgi:hypothetical protein